MGIVEGGAPDASSASQTRGDLINPDSAFQMLYTISNSESHSTASYTVINHITAPSGVAYIVRATPLLS